MDSLSQIVLGAAVGEAVLGKKIGNRAMLWGAIAGTIPDLDIISNLWLSPIEGLAAHRGITHSITFAVLGGLLLGYLVKQLYDSPLHYKISLGSRSLAYIALVLGLGYFTITSASLNLAIFGITLASIGGYVLYNRYMVQDLPTPQASVRDWQWLFFLGLVTHPILDCFTVYGTQLFAPFSDVRVAWSSVSVVDPLYTFPFMLCLIAASFYAKESRWRSMLNWAGLVWSCGYLLFTVCNKVYVHNIFAEAFEKQGYRTEKMLAAPTIMNNILWHGVARQDSTIVFGKYSHFDPDKNIKLYELPINEELISQYDDTKVVNILKWFSDGYYTITELDNKHLQLSDMRYGRYIDEDNNPENYIFKFEIFEKDGNLDMIESRGGPPDGSEKEFGQRLLKRILGNR